MNPRRKRTFLWILIPVLTVVSLGFLFVQYFLDPVHYRRIIQDSLTQTLGKEVSIGEARFSLWEGIGVTFEDVRIRDRSGTFDLLRSKKVFLRVKLLPLLKREIQWGRIILEEPDIRLFRNREGRFNFIDGPLEGEALKVSPKKMVETLSNLLRRFLFPQRRAPPIYRPEPWRAGPEDRDPVLESGGLKGFLPESLSLSTEREAG